MFLHFSDIGQPLLKLEFIKVIFYFPYLSWIRFYFTCMSEINSGKFDNLIWVGSLANIINTLFLVFSYIMNNYWIKELSRPWDWMDTTVKSNFDSNRKIHFHGIRLAHFRPSPPGIVLKFSLYYSDWLESYRPSLLW